MDLDLDVGPPPVPRGRPAALYVPVTVILIANVLGILDVVGTGVMFAADLAAIAYITGRAHEASSAAEVSRRAAVRAAESFVASAGRALDEGIVPEEEREVVERQVESATGLLRLLDKAAPVRVKVKHKWQRRAGRGG
jgi:hypothetical protein